MNDTLGKYETRLIKVAVRFLEGPALCMGLKLPRCYTHTLTSNTPHSHIHTHTYTHSLDTLMHTHTHTALLRKHQRIVQNYHLRYMSGFDAQLMRDVVMVRRKLLCQTIRNNVVWYKYLLNLCLILPA